MNGKMQKEYKLVSRTEHILFKSQTLILTRLKVNRTMDIDTQTNLAKLRAQGDVKTLKKVIKDFYKLVSKEINGEELYVLPLVLHLR